MYDKNYYRTTLNSYKKYIKLSNFALDVGISKSTLSTFMRGEPYNFVLSTEKLDSLINAIRSYCNQVSN